MQRVLESNEEKMLHDWTNYVGNNATAFTSCCNLSYFVFASI